jgi:competence protein ComGC
MYNGVNMSNIKKSAELGFTVVELLITILVGAIFIIGINTVYTTQSYINQHGRDQVVANAYIESKVEALRSQGFLTLTNGTTNITNELPSELNDASGSLEISSYNTATKKVVLTINYNEQGKDQTLSYSTFVGELGVGQY